MPAQPASDELLDFIVEAEAKQNDGSYNCEVFTAQIQAAIRDLDNAKLASRSALGQSASVDVDACQANLDRLLAARRLCLDRKAAVEAGATGDEALGMMPDRGTKGHSFDFSARRIE
ncbi:MAG: hypothetical protein KA004_18895 [Verrucomicrobiales bacterium]|nr:hypothetical protein [Verrucomicrobiales bacterium]